MGRPVAPAMEAGALEEEDMKALSTLSATALLCALSLGAGVFLMPSVMASLGLGAGVFLLLFFGAVSTAVAVFISQMADDAGAGSIRELIIRGATSATAPANPDPALAAVVPDAVVPDAVVPDGSLSASLLQRQSFRGAPSPSRGSTSAAGMTALLAYANVASIITLVTGNASHLQLITGMMFDLMEYFVTGDYGVYTFSLTHKAVLLGLFLLVVLPYCTLENLAALRHVGEAVSGTVIVTSAVVAVICLVRIANGTADGGAGGAHSLPSAPADLATLIRLVPTICFTYTSLFTLFPVREKLLAGHGQRSGAQKLRRAVLWAGALQALLYTALAVVAAVSFGTAAGESMHGHQKGNGNVLYNFPADNYLVTSLCLALVVVILLDYPVIQFSAVETAIGMAQPLVASRHAATYKRHARAGFSVVFALTVFAVVLFVPRLTDLFGLCGSLGISGYCYVVPGILLALRANRRAIRAFGLFVAVLGAAICIVSTTFIVEGIVAGPPPAAHPPPPSLPPPA